MGMRADECCETGVALEKEEEGRGITTHA